jgi:calpain-15
MFRESKNMNEDVVQGQLGDSNLLSVLIALFQSEKSNIKNIINPEAKPRDTAFESNVFINGEPVPVIIDDHFPVLSTNKLAFCGINKFSGNIWPIIIEKAWAKCNKTYENIISGNATESLEFLTPAPSDTFDHINEDNNDLLDNIKMALDNKYIVLADTNINENVEKLAKLGLITNHAYQVIDIASVKNPNGDDIQLLKIKNLLGGDWGLSPIPIKIYSTFYLFFIKK